MAKGPNDTAMTDAPLVIGLGPGFAAGVNCHAAIETKRGHRLGRVIWDGPTAPNTGVPGTVGGRSGERVLRSPASGTVWWDVAIADIVTAGQVIGRVGDAAISATIGGVVRGLLTPGLSAATGA